MGEFSRALILPRGFLTTEVPTQRTSVPPPVEAEQEDDGLIRIGGSGNVQVISLSHSASSNFSRSVVKENKRIIDKVRIKNPEDESQHVDVKRPKKIILENNDAGAPRRNVAGSVPPGYTAVVYSVQQPDKPGEVTEILEENITEKNEGGSGAP